MRSGFAEGLLVGFDGEGLTFGKKKVDRILAFGDMGDRCRNMMTREDIRYDRANGIGDSRNTAKAIVRIDLHIKSIGDGEFGANSNLFVIEWHKLAILYHNKYVM